MDKPKVLSKLNIEKIAEKFLMEYSPESLEKSGKVDLEYILENKMNITLDYQIMDEDNQILGLTAFNDGTLNVFDESGEKKTISVKRGTIVLNSKLAMAEKLQKVFQFTLGHETGHWYIHRELFLEYEGQTNFFDKMNESKKENLLCAKRDEKYQLRRSFKNNIEIIEWQADYFSSCVIMPKKTFLKAYYTLSEKYYSQNEIIHKLSDIFEVSFTACSIRLNNLLNKNDYEIDNILY